MQLDLNIFSNNKSNFAQLFLNSSKVSVVNFSCPLNI